MAEVFSVLLYMLYVLSLFSGGGHWTVKAEPSVSAWIVTPEVDRKEGGQVLMRCVATNLESDHIVEWFKDRSMSLRWGTQTITSNRRFLFQTTQTGNGQTTQNFTITNLHRDDNDEYVCNVREPIPDGGSTILSTARVALSVLYFPNKSFPICSPDGPITAKFGTDVELRCSSEAGNSAVTMEVTRISPVPSYLWTASNVNDTVFRSLSLTASAAADDITFECVISSAYYPGMAHSCLIGPICVSGLTKHMPGPPKATVGLQTTSSGAKQLPSSVPTAAFVVAVILLAASIFGNVFLITSVIKMRRFIKSLPDNETHLPKADPYMELQPTENNNKEYMEPAAKENTTERHSHYQAVESTDSTEHDNARPGDGNIREYEIVGKSKTADKLYQNIEG